MACISSRSPLHSLLSLFFLTAPATTAIYTLSLHDALPIWRPAIWHRLAVRRRRRPGLRRHHGAVEGLADGRSEEHTSELQSHVNLVCRLLLEKKKNKKSTN